MNNHYNDFLESKNEQRKPKNANKVFRMEEMPRQAKPIYYGNDIRNTYIRLAGSTQKASKPIPFALKADNLTREDDPPSMKAIREALVNLLMHMDYFDKKDARITVYDNQIELKNAGCLRFPLERLLSENITEPRNQLIAKAFRFLGPADRTGEGISKIINGWTSMKYDKPTIRDDKHAHFYEIIMPLDLMKDTVKDTREDTLKDTLKSLSDNEKTIIELIKKNSKITLEKMSIVLKINLRNTKKNIAKLKKKNLIERIGPDKTGYWKLVAGF